MKRYTINEQQKPPEGYEKKKNIIKGLALFLLLVFGIKVLLAPTSPVFHNYRPNNPNIRQIKELGEYTVYQEEQIPPSEVTSMIVDDGKIFLYHTTYEMVNVYTTDGDFLYGIQVGMQNNGSGDFAYHDSRLYIFAKVSNIYVFEETEFITMINGAVEAPRYERYAQEYLSDEKQTVYNGEVYQLIQDEDIIIKQTASGESVVVIDLRA